MCVKKYFSIYLFGFFAFSGFSFYSCATLRNWGFETAVRFLNHVTVSEYPTKH